MGGGFLSAEGRSRTQTAVLLKPLLSKADWTKVDGEKAAAALLVGQNPIGWRWKFFCVRLINPGSELIVNLRLLNAPLTLTLSIFSLEEF